MSATLRAFEVATEPEEGAMDRVLTIWFAYDVPGETLFYLSLLVPLGAGLLSSILALATRYARRRTT